MATKNFFSRAYIPYAQIKIKTMGKMAFPCAVFVGIMTCITMLVTQSSWGILVIIPLYFSFDIAVWLISRYKLLKQIKGWSQSYKDESLYNEIKENNLENVKILLRCGADINGKISRDNSEPWSDWRSWSFWTEHPLDAARTPKMKNFLRQRGAVRFSESSNEEEVI